MITALAEDMRVLLERSCGKERALSEQHATTDGGQLRSKVSSGRQLRPQETGPQLSWTRGIWDTGGGRCAGDELEVVKVPASQLDVVPSTVV